MINAMREWPELCRALGHPEWQRDDRFSDFSAMMKHRVALKALISDAVADEPLAALVPRLEAAALTFSVVQNLAEVVRDPQARANGIIRATGSDDPDYQFTVDSPLQLAEEAKRPPQQAPAPGEHSAQVLAELGFSAAEVAALAAAGVVGGS
jgi:formyl-CoA transferase